MVLSARDLQTQTSCPSYVKRSSSFFSQWAELACLVWCSPTSVSDLAAQAQSPRLQQFSSLMLWSHNASWCIPKSVVSLSAVLRGFSAPCLFHLARKCRSVCQNNAIDLRFYPTSEVKAQNYNFSYSISLNIASFSDIHAHPNTQQFFHCKNFHHFCLYWCSGDQNNFLGILSTFNLVLFFNLTFLKFLNTHFGVSQLYCL